MADAKPPQGNIFDRIKRAVTRLPIQHELTGEGDAVPTGEFHAMTGAESTARNKRNLAIAFAILGFIVLLYATTMLRLAQAAQGSEDVPADGVSIAAPALDQPQ